MRAILDGLIDSEDDYDNDGLSNSAEWTLGTKPNKIDTDKDGILDLDEISDGLNPLTGTTIQYTDTNTSISKTTLASSETTTIPWQGTTDAYTTTSESEESEVDSETTDLSVMMLPMFLLACINLLKRGKRI